jgi:phosphatidylglycerophosphate synthase
MESFQQRFERALALKDPAVEEWIDTVFHRPVAAALSAVLLPTEVSSDQVTFGSMALGLTGSLFLYAGYFVPGVAHAPATIVAAVLLFGSVIFDCADGQLARARGSGSMTGRMIDGVADNVVVIASYWIIAFILYDAWGLIGLVSAVVGGLMMSFRTMMYDNYRAVFVKHVEDRGAEEGQPSRREAAKAAMRDARLQGDTFDAYLLNIYLGWLWLQRTFPGADDDTTDAIPDLSDRERRAYRAEHGPTMRLATWLGLGTHMVLFYGLILASAFWIDALMLLQVIFIVPGGLLMAVCAWRGRRMNL